MLSSTAGETELGDILRLHRIIMPPADPPPSEAGPARPRGLNARWLPLIVLLASAAISYLLLGGELPSPGRPLFADSGRIDISRLVK